MSDLKHVLFICTGNTCRSPMAEALFLKAVEGRSDFEASSAGVAASKGTGFNPETEALLKRRGAMREGFRSRPVTDAILEKSTHVFAMTRSHLQMLEAQFPKHADKYYLMCEFADIPGEGVGADIPDPIGLGRKAYEEVAGILDIAIPTIISYVDQTWKPAEGNA